MNGYVFGAKLCDFVYRIFKILRGFLRKPCYEVAVDYRKSVSAGKTESIVNLPVCMVSADYMKCFLLHSLRIYAYSVYIMLRKRLYFGFCNCIWSACLYGKFLNPLKIYILLYMRKQSVKLILIKCCRRTAAYIYAFGNYP